MATKALSGLMTRQFLFVYNKKIDIFKKRNTFPNIVSFFSHKERLLRNLYRTITLNTRNQQEIEKSM